MGSLSFCAELPALLTEAAALPLLVGSGGVALEAPAMLADGIAGAEARLDRAASKLLSLSESFDLSLSILGEDGFFLALPHPGLCVLSAKPSAGLCAGRTLSSLPMTLEPSALPAHTIHRVMDSPSAHAESEEAKKKASSKHESTVPVSTARLHQRQD